MVLTEKPIRDLDKNVTELTDHYTDLHREFDTYRGRLLKDEELVAANKLIDEIHKTYAELHQVAFWVAHRYEWAINIANSHKQFLDDLEAAIGKTNGQS